MLAPCLDVQPLLLIIHPPSRPFLRIHPIHPSTHRKVIRRRRPSDADDPSTHAAAAAGPRLRRAVDSFVSTFTHGFEFEGLSPLRGAAQAAIARVASGLLMGSPSDDDGVTSDDGGGRRSSFDVTRQLFGALRRSGLGGSQPALDGLGYGSGYTSPVTAAAAAAAAMQGAGGGAFAAHSRSRLSQPGRGAVGISGGPFAVIAAAAGSGGVGGLHASHPPQHAPEGQHQPVPQPLPGVPFVWPAGSRPPPLPMASVESVDEAEAGVKGTGTAPQSTATAAAAAAVAGAGGQPPQQGGPEPRPQFLDMVPWYSGGGSWCGGLVDGWRLNAMGWHVMK